MMSFNVDNIEIGAGNLTLQYPDDVSPVDIGGCTDAVFKPSLESLDVFFDQAIDPVDSFDIRSEVTFEVTMKEDILRNLVIAMGGDPSEIDSSDVDDDVFNIPGGSVRKSKFAVLHYDAPTIEDKTKSKIVHLYKVKVQGGTEVPFKKDEERMYAVVFKAFAPGDEELGGSPGYVSYPKVS